MYRMIFSLENGELWYQIDQVHTTFDLNLI